MSEDIIEEAMDPIEREIAETQELVAKFHETYAQAGIEPELPYGFLGKVVKPKGKIRYIRENGSSLNVTAYEVQAKRELGVVTPQITDKVS